MNRTGHIAWSLAVLLALAGSGFAAEAPKLIELHTQRVGEQTYFRVRFEQPADLSLPDWNRFRFRGGLGLWEKDLARMPQLVGQDGKTRTTYWRMDARSRELLLGRMGRFDVIESRIVPPGQPQPAPAAPAPVKGLEFYGRLQGQGQAIFRLLYPITEKAKAGTDNLVANLLSRRGWADNAVTLDFERAKTLPVPESASKRKATQPPDADDLEGQWAVTQAERLAVLEAQVHEFGFYGFARTATGRKYNVPAAPPFGLGWDNDRLRLDRQLYETTTGATAIAESLALHRMVSPNFRDTGERSIDIAKLTGIDIAEHPWKKMIGAKQPAPEPLAKLIPDDNYYIHFKQIDKLIEFGELMDLWGTSLTRAFEVTSRDSGLKNRYETQLCLHSSWLGKTFGPAAVRSVAITGSDLYLREGSDLALIFQVVNRPLFLAAVDRFIQEARKEQGDRLQESKDTYHEVVIENFVTPLREVSLHRASLGNQVIYANSKAGIRRIIDTQQGRHKALADSLDFQYMRTIFQRDDPAENGFAFLSDPFIRQLVGPASKIKEKRRLEALTSLHMETNAALFSAWETGKLPDDQNRLLVSATLKPEMVYTPEGKGLLWDQRRNLAVSDAYNTIQFATPLIELPIDKVTKQEQQDYERFRLEYLGLWRQYFDPVGFRIGIKDSRVQLDTYILPLVRTSQYNELRRHTGGGTTELDPARFSSRTIGQFTMHIAPDAPGRTFLTSGLRSLGVLGQNKGLDWLGNWLIVRLDDSPVYEKLALLGLKQEFAKEELKEDAVGTEIGLASQVPLTVGVGIRNPLVFAVFLTAVKANVQQAVPDIEWAPLEKPYKDVRIVRIRPRPKSELAREFKNAESAGIFYAIVDGGWYVSFSEEPLHDLIDRAAARRQNKETKPATVAINSSLYLAPSAADKTQGLLQAYLEWETQRRALGNAPVWYCLYHGGLVKPDADAATLQRTAQQFFGFVPVSPDGAGYTFDVKTDEVVNRRHGSPARPRFQGKLAEGAPLEKLLRQFRSIRADLRFREDGVHTVLTIDRKK